MTTRLPTLFIPHGGGPCFFMEPMFGPKDTWDRLAAYLRGIAATLETTPKAILVISGHWETDVPTVNTGAHPPLLFDYYNFPEHTYRLTYPAPGSPDLAARVQRAISTAIDQGLRTADIFSPGHTLVSTKQMGDAVCKIIETSDATKNAV